MSANSNTVVDHWKHALNCTLFCVLWFLFSIQFSDYSTTTVTKINLRICFLNMVHCKGTGPCTKAVSKRQYLGLHVLVQLLGFVFDYGVFKISP